MFTRLSEPVSVLMPVFNEADVIRDVVEEWAALVFAKLPEGSELILDDCSDDGTREILAELERRHSFLRVNYTKRDGFFNSACRLYRQATCPLVFFTDSDGQYHPADFWKVAEHIHDHDMVHGYKTNRKDPLYRLAASAIFNLFVATLFSSQCADVNSAFRLIRRKPKDAGVDQLVHIKLLPNTELYLRLEAAGYQIKNVPIRHRVRAAGSSRGLPFAKIVVEAPGVIRGLVALRWEFFKTRRPAAPARPPEAEGETAASKAPLGAE